MAAASLRASSWLGEGPTARAKSAPKHRREQRAWRRPRRSPRARRTSRRSGARARVGGRSGGWRLMSAVALVSLAPRRPSLRASVALQSGASTSSCRATRARARAASSAGTAPRLRAQARGAQRQALGAWTPCRALVRFGRVSHTFWGRAASPSVPQPRKPETAGHLSSASTCNGARSRFR